MSSLPACFSAGSDTVSRNSLLALNSHTCIHTHLSQRVCDSVCSHMQLALISIREHVSIKPILQPPRDSISMGRFSEATIWYLLQPVILVDLQISCGDLAPSLCQCGQAQLDRFLDPAFLMRDISTLAKLSGTVHKNGRECGAAQQNCPTGFVQ